MAKPGPTQDLDRIAEILVTAAYQGDEAAAEAHNITVRTVQNYRARMRSDAILSQLFASKRKIAESDWGKELSSAISRNIAFLSRAANEADPKDPEAIHAIAGGLKILTEVATTKRILDARLAPEDRTVGSADSAMGAKEEAEDQAPIIH